MKKNPDFPLLEHLRGIKLLMQAESHFIAMQDVPLLVGNYSIKNNVALTATHPRKAKFVPKTLCDIASKVNIRQTST